MRKRQLRRLGVSLGSLVLVCAILAGWYWVWTTADESPHLRQASAVTAQQPRELIVVTVSEYDDTDGFAIDIAPAGILHQLHPSQTYDVVVINSGGIAHELRVMPMAVAGMNHNQEGCPSAALLCVRNDELSHRGAIVHEELTFPEVGDYVFVCHMHPGMEATVTVVS